MENINYNGLKDLEQEILSNQIAGEYDSGSIESKNERLHGK